MKRIASFEVDHDAMVPGLYLSREDHVGEHIIYTYDIRVVKPNTPPFMTSTQMHSVEHLFATFLRNNYDDVIYFGPMGCSTGFYALFSKAHTLEEIRQRVIRCCDFIEQYEGKLPGESSKECGNYKDLNLADAKGIACRIKHILSTPL